MIGALFTQSLVYNDILALYFPTNFAQLLEEAATVCGLRSKSPIVLNCPPQNWRRLTDPTFHLF